MLCSSIKSYKVPNSYEITQMSTLNCTNVIMERKILEENTPMSITFGDNVIGISPNSQTNITELTIVHYRQFRHISQIK